MLDNSSHWGICHDDGLCLYDLVSQTWTDYPSDLPVMDAFYLDGENILVIMGCGTDSDGIYSFDPDDGQFTVVEYLECPHFIAYDDIIQKYYVGYQRGMVSSLDGLNWVPVSVFDELDMVSMAIYENHLVAGKSIAGTWVSGDHGNTWSPSSLGSPWICDMAFDHDQKLYGVFPDESWSSGLWSSADFGETWEVEFYSPNMKSVGIDVFGDVYVGWDENPSGSDEGIARYDLETGDLTFINEGLSSLVINEIRVNPTMSAIALFCCTDSGAYMSIDYFLGINDEMIGPTGISLKIFPNPAEARTSIFYNIPSQTDGFIIYLISPKGEQIMKFHPEKAQGKIQVNTSDFSKGLYLVTLDFSAGSICRKLIVQ